MIETLQAAFLGAIESENPTKQVVKWIRAGNLDDYLKDSEKPETIHVFAVGKAAASMAWGLAETNVPLVGHGVLPKGVAAPAIPGLKWRYGAHPNPDDSSFEAGKLWLELARNIPENAPVLILLSGGASSLLEWPAQESPNLSQDIVELNAQREQTSELKGGKWVRILKQRTSRVRALILPDVPPGQEAEVVGSGLAFGADCHVLRGNGAFVAEMAGLLESFGVATSVYDERLTGPLDEQVSKFVQANERGKVLIGGGECTISTPSFPGGRCQHAALLAGTMGVSLMALGTDGVDGTTKNAGAWSGPDANPDAKQALRNFTAADYLEKRGQNIKTGPTGTNVNDVWLLWTAKY